MVAHNVVNRVLLADLLGLPLKQAKDIRQANCCINVIRRKNDQVELITIECGVQSVRRRVVIQRSARGDMTVTKVSSHTNNAIPRRRVPVAELARVQTAQEILPH